MFRVAVTSAALPHFVSAGSLYARPPNNNMGQQDLLPLLTGEQRYCTNDGSEAVRADV